MHLLYVGKTSLEDDNASNLHGIHLRNETEHFIRCDYSQ